MVINIYSNKVMAVDNKFYVYVWYIEGTPVYVGKGCGERAYRNKEYDVEIYRNNLTESEAYELESILIKEYGRLDKGEGSLQNLTNGGGMAFSSLYWRGDVLKEKHQEGIRKRSEREGWKQAQAERAKHAARSREANWQDSIYVVMEPVGNILKLSTQELKRYCKDKKISLSSMKDTARGTPRGGSTAGYKVEFVYNKVTGKRQDEKMLREKFTSEI